MTLTLKVFIFVAILHTVFASKYNFDDKGNVVVKGFLNSNSVGNFPKLKPDLRQKLDAAFEQHIFDLQDPANIHKRFIVDAEGVSVLFTVALKVLNRSAGKIDRISIVDRTLPDGGYDVYPEKRNLAFSPISSLQETRAEVSDRTPEDALEIGTDYISGDLFRGLRDVKKLVRDNPSVEFKARLVYGTDVDFVKATYLLFAVYYSKTKYERSCGIPF